MKKNILLILLILPITHSCTTDIGEEPESIKYAEVITKIATDIDSLGVTLNASIKINRELEIIDLGFEFIRNTDSVRISTKDNIASLDSITTRVNVKILDDSIYYYRVYLKTEETCIYGGLLSFVGANYDPLIYDMNPKTGFDRDIIKLKGKFFSKVNDNNYVFVNNIPCKIISSYPDSIFFEIPYNEFIGDVDISLKVGYRESPDKPRFDILGPQITSISSLSEHSGEYVTIKGQNFLKNGENIDLYWGEAKAFIVDTTNTALIVVVPPIYSSLLNNTKVTIKLINGKKEICHLDKFEVKKSWTTKKANRNFEWSWIYSGFNYNNEGYVLEYNTLKLHKYNSESNSWGISQIEDFPGLRLDEASYVVQNNEVYKVGGRHPAEGACNQLWCFNFSIRKWTQKPNLPFNYDNWYCSYFIDKDYVYIVTQKQEVWKCNFVTNTYTQLGNFPIEINSFSGAFKSNGENYIVLFGSTWLYDAINDQWIEKAKNTFYHSQYSPINTQCFTHNGTGYLMENGSKLYKYDSIDDRWILASYYPGPNGLETNFLNFYLGTSSYIMATYSHLQGGASHLFEYNIK